MRMIPGGRRWPLSLWLTVVALGAAALWGAMTLTARSDARVPSGRPSAGASRPEPAPGEAKAVVRPVFGLPLLTGGGTPPPSPAPDPMATASVSGRVVDALGGPILGAVVTAFRGRSTLLLSSTVTVSDGRFEMRVAPGPVRIVAQAEAYSTVQQQAAAPASDLTLALAPASRIFGRVLGVDAPVSGIVVRARIVGRLEELVASVLTDAEGHFRFEALSAGEYELSVAAERISGEAERVTIGVADERGPVELRVAPAARVTFDVERGGRPCSEGWVHLECPRFQAAREIVDGRVLFEGVPPGNYQLMLGCEDAAFQSRNVEVGEADIDDMIRLDPGQTLAGRVVSASGAGAPGVLVTVSPMEANAGNAQMTCRSGPS
jgi:hypothetical protein